MAVAILWNAITVTGFVLVMMLLVEFLNVATRGVVRQRLQKSGGRFPAVLIGTVPGCFGAFTNVTLYVHGTVSFGALAGSMIAASGDEAFVMLALFPGRALILFGVLFASGLAVAWIVDRLFGMRFYRQANCASGLTLHDEEAKAFHPLRWPAGGVSWSLERVLLTGGLLAFALSLGAGAVAADAPAWMRALLVVLGLLLAGFVVVAPSHFVREHLIRHVVREHAPRIFLWTFGALVVTEWVTHSGFGLEAFVRDHTALALVVAVAIGVIPESGPHVMFATLYASGVLPFSVLLASSAVQDGHGMLPLLAESRVEFLRVKAVNIVAGLALGCGAMLLGF
ncbi:MAG: putative manganese transporter [Vicinamibacterales bacterium]